MAVGDSPAVIGRSAFMSEVRRLGLQHDDMYSAVLAVCKQNGIEPPRTTDNVYMAMKIIDQRLREERGITGTDTD